MFSADKIKACYAQELMADILLACHTLYSFKNHMARYIKTIFDVFSAPAKKNADV
jgi:hypothetical protein